MTQDQLISAGFGIMMVALGGALILGIYDRAFPFNRIQSIAGRRWMAGLAGVMFICQGFIFLWRIF
jgi:hypothetical protein